MRKSLMMGTAIACAFATAACNPIHIPNPFGGPGLVLTGNLRADLPGIQAFSASIKAGVAKDAAAVRAAFVQACPHIAEARDALPSALAQTGISLVTQGSPTAAQKMNNNITTALLVGDKFCAAGTADNLRSAFVNAVDAVVTVQSLINTGAAK